jgi:hypothetical protein
VGFCGVFKDFSGFGFFLLPNRIYARPHAGNASRSAIIKKGMEIVERCVYIEAMQHYES